MVLSEPLGGAMAPLAPPGSALDGKTHYAVIRSVQKRRIGEPRDVWGGGGGSKTTYDFCICVFNVELHGSSVAMSVGSSANRHG